MQPNAEERKRIIKPRKIENDFAEIVLPEPRKDRMPEILGSFLQDILNDENSSDRFSPNTKMYEMIQAARNTSIECNTTEPECSSSNTISVLSSGAQSMMLDEISIKTPSKSSSIETVMSAVGSSRSRRKTMLPVISYSELSDDDSTTKASSAPKTPSKKTASRRRTLFPSFSSETTKGSVDDMSISSSISNMSISHVITSPKKAIAKTSKRRKTTHIGSAMDVTQSQVQASKTSDNNQSCVALLTPSINEITDNVQFKTPPRTLSATTKSTGRKKISPLIKSVLRRRTMHSALVQMPVSNVTPANTLSNSLSATKSTRRRTLFTPNKLVEINKKLEMGSRDQLNDNATTSNETTNGK